MQLVMLSTLTVVLVICVYTDLTSRTIYNKVLVPALVLGIGFQIVDKGVQGLVFGGEGFLLGLAIFFIPFALGGIGAGDVKLMAVVGVFLGWEQVINAGLYGAALGGIFALIQLYKQKRVGKALRNILTALKMFLMLPSAKVLQTLDNSEAEASLPYAVPLVLGTFLAMALGG